MCTERILDGMRFRDGGTQMRVEFLAVAASLGFFATPAMGDTCTADDDHPECTITCDNGCIASVRLDTGECIAYCTDERLRASKKSAASLISIKAIHMSVSDIQRTLKKMQKR